MMICKVKIGIFFFLLAGFFSITAGNVNAGDARWPDKQNNLAFGESYIFNREPDYALCKNPDIDMLKLTDGKFAESSGIFWSQKNATVGFRSGIVNITIDLAKIQSIDKVYLHTAAGRAGVEPPAYIRIYTSDDGIKYSLAGQIRPRPLKQSEEKIFTLEVPITAKGRYVSIAVLPRGKYFFCDEIAIGRGAKDIKTAKLNRKVYEKEPYDNSIYPITITVVPADWQNTDGFNKKFVIAKGLSCSLLCLFKGNTANIGPATLVLDLPEGITVTAAWPKKSIYASPYKAYEYRSVQQGNRTIVSINLGDTIRKEANMNRVRKRIYLNGDKCKDGFQDKVTLFLKDEKRRLSKKTTFNLLVRKRIPLRQKPRYFSFGLSYAYSLRCPVDAVRKEYREFFSNLGFCRFFVHPWVLAQDDIAIRELGDLGWEAGYMTGWGPTGPNFVKSMDISDMSHAVGKDGKQMNLLCHSAMLDDCEKVWTALENNIRRTLKKFPSISRFYLDFEPYGPSSPQKSCFCKTCIDNFIEFAGIDKEKLSSSEILDKYQEEWLSFRTKQNTALVEKYFSIAKKVNPKLTFVMCNYYYRTLKKHQNILKLCGFDPLGFEKFVDYSLPMIYCSGTNFFDDVKLNFEKMQKPVIPLIDPGEYSYTYFSNYDPRKVRMNILAAASLGGKGIDFWPSELGMDGGYYVYIARASGEIAKFEEFYQHGKNHRQNISVTTTNMESLRYTTHRIGKKVLVTIFNYHPEKILTCNIAGQRIRKKTVSIQPEDVCFIILEMRR